MGVGRVVDVESSVGIARKEERKKGRKRKNLQNTGETQQ